MGINEIIKSHRYSENEITILYHHFMSKKTEIQRG